MTKIGNRSQGKNFSLILFTGLLLGACAKSSHSALMQKSIETSAQQVIGGDKVAATSPVASKVMYLAYGVKLEKTPHSTSIAWGGHCTAAAISPSVILTAAHCVDNRSASEIYITLSKSPETEPLNLKQWYAAKKIAVHEHYTGESTHYVNDLALILLDRELPPAQVTKLATQAQVHLPQTFMTVGFGITTDLSDPNPDDKNPSELRFVMKNLQELNANSKFFSLDQTDHKGFCSGDSGGPGIIVDPKTKELFILGVVSNTSMLDTEDKALDPQGIYSLCIGHGNYTNTLNPELRSWILKSQAALEKSNP